MKSYFDTIPHELLMEQVGRCIGDGRLLNLIGLFLKQGVMDDMERWIPTGGTLQGAVLSPLLANIYLHPLDKLVIEAGMKMVRCADDFVNPMQRQIAGARGITACMGMDRRQWPDAPSGQNPSGRL